MKKTLRTLIAIAVFGFIAGTFSSCGYNSLVNKEETVTAAWAQVENVYQRRLDLIENLVQTVKGAANFEKSTLESVIEARAKATQVNIDPTNLTPENVQQFEQAQNQLSSALSRLLVTVERYPELKANQNFLTLQDQIEGTENRIAVERKKFIEAVQDYNASRRRFPTNITAGLFGFEAKGTFHATPGAEKAPKVDFGDFNNDQPSANPGDTSK
jgi:LemA protein